MDDDEFDDRDKISDPDWDRYLVGSQGTPPVGDPTRWGAQYESQLTDANSVGPTGNLTPQILQISSRDSYARSWSMIGTLTLPLATWNALQIVAQLEITMGVGQAQLLHVIPLFYPAGTFGAAATPFAAGGLCLSQLNYYGGPYSEVQADGLLYTRSFAIIGGLVGQSLAVRVRYLAAPFPPTTGFPTAARVSMLVTPYAAGTGL
jgi:hypothetical protein